MYAIGYYMGNDMTVIHVKVAISLVDRAVRLQEPLGADVSHSNHGAVTKAYVIREALLRGVEALESEYSAESTG